MTAVVICVFVIISVYCTFLTQDILQMCQTALKGQYVVLAMKYKQIQYEIMR